ncbi:cytochrome d ubiquinol oxidase subunit II [Halorussus sp. MSC15.2]|uniref:cytochrome d ubiquinol oxidase subunit II n=1 Tax=Halorussus sp. MSC15.2 TaxID=2283638 RepID=UPI0013D524D5|nr:cytochrome d ubiquinol oxidase subunit II [Halorussus sp. MSC15.2]NEU58439.1 cytochrome D ubiquinol oxidase subunit II [Halorussus sp. MSC15.2]
MINPLPLQTVWFGVALSDLWFGVVFAFLAVFLFLDGWDFGVGVIFATRDDHHEREQCLAAIGPFWDGNEVWLVVFGGGLFAAFPPVYAALFSRHYLLLFGVLGALVLRGMAPEFFEQREDRRWRTWWGRAFVAGSVGAPLLLGVFVGNWLLGVEGVAPASIVVGLAVVALNVASGAAFLRLKTTGPLAEEMADDGARAMAGYLGLVALALGLLALRPGPRGALLSPLPVALVVGSLLLGVGYVVAARRDRPYLALGASGVVTGALVALVAVLMYPIVEPATGLTVEKAIVGSPAVELLTAGATVLIPLVLTYFGVLYSAFSGPIDPEESY